MIKILYPHGCYGTYFSRCLFNYTTLSSHQLGNFDFDEHGSSHVFRNNLSANENIWHGHLDSFELNSQDVVITILPESDHFLDYYDNYFSKQEQGAIINYLTKQISQEEIKYKLKQYWNYTSDIADDKIPKWILREWLSFWISQSWNDGYNSKNYQSIASKLNFGTQSIIKNLIDVLHNACQAINQSLRASQTLILENHTKFLQHQKFLDIQIKCQQWVEQILTSKNNYASPCITIFDEAFVQHLLRKHKFEILCNELNTFPVTSFEMKKIIFQI